MAPMSTSYLSLAPKPRGVSMTTWSKSSSLHVASSCSLPFAPFAMASGVASDVPAELAQPGIGERIAEDLTDRTHGRRRHGRTAGARRRRIEPGLRKLDVRHAGRAGAGCGGSVVVCVHRERGGLHGEELRCARVYSMRRSAQ